MRKTMSTLFATLALFIGGLVMAPTASAAGYGCSGNLIDTYDVKTSGGVKYGVVYLYYSTANGGTNCAVTVDTYFGTSTTKHMAIFIGRCAAGSVEGQSCSQDQYTSDSGRYTSYAGPRSVTGAASRCVTLNGVIHNPSGTSLAQVVTLAVHC
ncbi:hypothetical protein QQY66_24380 [Streptomyces sp. DG2A-72]|uniref:hypothetical protein n=1 Tax=Streptomyces sp. DG2A-72 TaxID=3051386 RepID=UPI00265B79A0|nr:hypothetical protein [Streptomyces sp. DG2A-72]MDO0934664.1 hypothetical protein [Streptomyces sp. DG2A-72]